MSQSRTEAEYRAIADTTLELRWLCASCAIWVSLWLLLFSYIVTTKVPLLSPPNMSFMIAQNILRSTVILLVRNMKKAESLFLVFFLKLSWLIYSPRHKSQLNFARFCFQTLDVWSTISLRKVIDTLIQHMMHCI